MKPKYSQINKNHTLLAAGLLTASFVVTPSVQASDWTGASGNWSSTVSPGWTVGGVPNAVGAVANYSGNASVTTTQDSVGGVTVGTISWTGSGDRNWTITNTNGITLNQVADGVGTATISNTNNSAGSNNGVSITGGTLTLADNLLISNTGASTRNSGSINISSVIAGTGNITINNAGNSGTGAIVISGTNTFTGNVNVRSGRTNIQGNSVFGNNGNQITLGAESAGNASLFFTGGINNQTYTWVVAAGSGGTLTMGSDSSTSSSVTLGSFTLNDNLVFNRGSATNSTNVTSVSGTGGITKTGAGILKIGSSGTYSGITTVSAGILRISSATAMQNSALDTSASVAGDATNGFQIDSTATSITAITLGGLIGDKDLKTAAGGVFTTTGNRYSSITGLTLNPGTGVTRTYSAAIANGAVAGMSLTKTGLGTQVLSGTNTYTGATTVSAGTLVVDGSISTSSLTTVASGGTLGGTGTVGKTVISSGGTLAVGTSPGTMTFTDTLGLSGTTVMEIDGTAGAGVNPNGHDFINLTGAGAAGVLTYGGTMTLDIGTTFGIGTYSWNLFDFASETGGFTSITLADQYSGSLTDAGGGVWGNTSGFNTWQFTESTGILGLTVVPEPGAALLGSLGMLMLLRRRR
jgi:autotransporter-associated beta strand protein